MERALDLLREMGENPPDPPVYLHRREGNYLAQAAGCDPYDL